MAALIDDRDTQEKYDPAGFRHDFIGASSTQFFKGGLVGLVGGVLVKLSAATVGCSAVFICEDNILTGAANTRRIGCRSGIFKLVNVGGIASTDEGKITYVSDDQSVTLTGAPATDVVVGPLYDVDTDGVWVRILGLSREAIPTAAVVTGS